MDTDAFEGKVVEDELLNATKSVGDESSTANLRELVTVRGPTSLQHSIHDLCEEFKDIFSSSVRAEPAKVPPLVLEVDREKWETRHNRGPPRFLTQEKDRDLRKQVDRLLRCGVIQPVTASEYSQIHLVRKPDKSWRFCLDFVRLNEATKVSEGWPLQNIATMLRRIGNRKPTFFGKMDLTAGYHQAPLHMDSRKYTAFITFMGVYQWNRVPMGLKGAPSYFQRIMAMNVLAGLIYSTCEVYLDDVLVMGNTEEDFISNLRSVFERLRHFGLTLNPNKCEFGAEELEFVGHILRSGGMSFSTEKRNKVLDFPCPTTVKQLRAFIGLVNYFRDHVKNISGLVKPLQLMVDECNGQRGTKLKWTHLASTVFEKVKESVGNCPSLYFVDESSPVYVQTDASDYGIGGYIFQVKEGRHYPIIFISKALNKQQINWSTIEKEAFAIYYTLKKYDYLLRDVRFVLQTDHKNLTYLKMATSAKVQRWRLEVQEYNFHIEYIPGIGNIPADCFSRLCDNASASTDTSREGDEVIDKEANSRPGTLSLNALAVELVIPAERLVLLQRYHNSTVGHFGRDRTLRMLVADAHRWQYMRSHVAKFIQSCPVCQLRDPLHKQIKTHRFTTASYTPMEVLNVDTIGPLEADASGKRYVLVIIDCFTRFVELYALPDTSALECARAILSHVGRYGAPMYIRSDRGSQFVNGLIRDLLRLMGVEHQLTLAYSKESNAIVERSNKEVMRHLTAILFDRRILSVWSMEYLPLVQRIINAQEHDSIGVSPAELLYGNSINLYNGLLSPILMEEKEEEASEPGKLSDFVGNLLKVQTNLIQVAQEKQLIQDSYHISEVDDDLMGFPINSYVLYNPPGGQRHKMQLPKAGPYLVVNSVLDDYTIQDLVNHKLITTHISNLSKFEFDDNRVDPKLVAIHNRGEFTVDSVVAHRGLPTRRSTMEFKVKWKGYPNESDDTWEPYKGIKDTQAFLDYCNTHKLKVLVPSKFRQ